MTKTSTEFQTVNLLRYDFPKKINLIPVRFKIKIGEIILFFIIEFLFLLVVGHLVMRNCIA